MKSYAKFISKDFFLEMFKFLLTFFIDIITPVISSTQTACDVMCVQYVIHYFLYSLQKKIYFFSIVFFCKPSFY